MLHFHTVLGPGWPMILFTLEDSWSLPPSPSFRRAVEEGRIEIRFLPPGTWLKNSTSVSLFLTHPWLWEQVAQAERVLLFQTDSILCANAEATVDDFLAYDYLGAPIDAAYGAGYNGGLSLRNPRLFLNITQEADFGASGVGYEDQFFYREALARVGSHGVRLPEPEVAMTFAVETIYYETPVGYHQPQRWQSERMGEIERWCPEVGP
jgi:hypothetical protein